MEKFESGPDNRGISAQELRECLEEDGRNIGENFKALANAYAQGDEDREKVIQLMTGYVEHKLDLVDIRMKRSSETKE